MRSSEFTSEAKTLAAASGAVRAYFGDRQRSRACLEDMLTENLICRTLR